MATRWGMSDKLGMVQLAPRQTTWTGGPGGFVGEKPYSEETARLIDTEVAETIRTCHEEAKGLLRKHRKELDALVAALLKEESLDEPQILEATGLSPAPPLSDRPLVE